MHAEIRTRFGEVADAYGAFRVGYADTVWDHVERHWGLGPGTRVLDLGAGTGLASRSLAERGARVTAIEPDPPMRVQAAAALGPLGVDVRDGRAEAIPADDGAFDLVVAAQAAHWFQEPEAGHEVRRVLRRGGAAVYVWKVPDPAEPYESLVAEELARLGGRHEVSFGIGTWPPLVAEGWEGFRRDVLEQGVEYTTASWLGFIRSRWSITESAGDRKEALLAALERRLRGRVGDGPFTERNLVYVLGARAA
jgi:SAM-dependent methyltransferase